MSNATNFRIDTHKGLRFRASMFFALVVIDAVAVGNVLLSIASAVVS